MMMVCTTMHKHKWRYVVTGDIISIGCPPMEFKAAAGGKVNISVEGLLEAVEKKMLYPAGDTLFTLKVLHASLEKEATNGYIPL